MKLFSAAALAAVTILAAGCSGCTTPAVFSNNHGVLEGQKVDEQAMGAVYALGTAANVAIKVAAKSGAIDAPTAVKVKVAKAKMDQVIAAAETAYAAGDAVTFSARLKEVTSLSNQISDLVKGAS